MKFKNAKRGKKLAEVPKKKPESQKIPTDDEITAGARKKLEDLWAKQEADGSLEEKPKPDDNLNTYYREYFTAANDYDPLFLHKTTEDSIREIKPSTEEGTIKTLAVAFDYVVMYFGPLVLLL